MLHSFIPHIHLRIIRIIKRELQRLHTKSDYTPVFNSCKKNLQTEHTVGYFLVHVQTVTKTQ
jgi:hypothetical protein